tara:strand:- start:5723 stop:5917 length:195 start_codon:yes stop_codon:yes gene_type:complete
MASEWILHVKKVAKDKGISYKESMKVAKETYKPKPKSKPKKETHTMPDGSEMVGKTHSKDSKEY